MRTVGIEALTSRLPKHIESQGKPKLPFPERGGRLRFSGGTRRSRERKEDELDAVPSQPSGFPVPRILLLISRRGRNIHKRLERMDHLTPA